MGTRLSRFAAVVVTVCASSAAAQDLDGFWLKLNVRGTGLSIQIADDSVRRKGKFKGICYMQVLWNGASYTGDTACETARNLWMETNGGPTFTPFSDDGGVAVSSYVYYTNRQGFDIEGPGTHLLTPTYNKAGVLKKVRLESHGEIYGSSSVDPGVSQFLGGYQVKGVSVPERRVPDDAVRALAPHPAPSAASASAILALVNDHRSSGAVCGGVAYSPVGALTLDSSLNEAAARHALDMARFDYFSHTGRDGSSHTDRIRDAGFGGGATGENIAAGYPTAAAVVAGWMASPGHCANIMNAVYAYMGAGEATMASSEYGTYWTQTFGGN